MSNQNQNPKPKPAWGKYSGHYTNVTHMLFNLPDHTSMNELNAVVWTRRLLEELDTIDPKTELTAAERRDLTVLACRISLSSATDPAYSHDDWVDAIATFPGHIDIPSMLVLDDDAFVGACQMLARYKRETYCDEPHTLSAQDILNFINSQAAIARKAGE